MKQKIYTEKTTFVGIDAPSGQEYNVTVDGTGKLISEPKPDLQKTLDNGNMADGVGIMLTDGTSLGQYGADHIGINAGSTGIVISKEQEGFLYAGANGRVHLGDRDGVVGLNFETLSAKMNIVPPTSFGNATHTLQNKSGVIAHLTDVEDVLTSAQDLMLTNVITTATGQSYINFTRAETLIVLTASPLTINIPNPTTHSGKKAIIKCKGSTTIGVSGGVTDGISNLAGDLTTTVSSSTIAIFISDGTVWQQIQ